MPFSALVAASQTSPYDPQLFWRSFIEFLGANGPSILWRVALAALLLTVGRWLAHLALNLLDRHLARTRLDPTLRRFLCGVARVFTIIVIVLAVLDLFGVQGTSIVAVLGAAAVAVGLSLKDSLTNFASGVLLVAFRPFRVGDDIESGGVAGTVEEIGVMATRVCTRDNRLVIVPNSALVTQTVTNNSAKDVRRVDAKAGVAYGDDLRVAREIILGVIAADPRFLETPAPEAYVDALGDFSVSITLTAWAKTADFSAARKALPERLKTALEAGGCTLPFPQREVRILK
ncbi:MAG: mechanosensitive ion channel family protein [Puniceicoccales bacterium]|nr:mechanosensitive ion channel family protein [Puniceicoccales bacterium]